MNKNWFIAYANRDKYHPNGYAPVTIYDENGIITTIEEGSREKSLAIAQLIVSAVNSKTKNEAAPDLLEACKALLDATIRHPFDIKTFNQATRQAQAAIAKAEREEYGEMKTIDKSYCGFCSSENCDYREKPCPTYCAKCGTREVTAACMTAGLDNSGYMCSACLDKEHKEYQAAREGLLAGMA